MKITLDTEARTVVREDAAGREEVPLFSDRAFEILSREWVRVGWNQKYSYTFSWFGRPIIQLPEDMVRTQEVIHRVQPDVIIETGVVGLIAFAFLLWRLLLTTLTELNAIAALATMGLKRIPKVG